MAYSELKNIQNMWQVETTTANDLFHNKEYTLALAHYKKAQIVGEIMVRNVDDAGLYNIPAIQPFSVSCTNLAYNFWVLNDIQKATNYFFYNIWCLKQLSERKNLKQKLRSEATDEWSNAVSAFIDFHHKTGQALSVDFWKDETYNTIKDVKLSLEDRKTNLN